MSNLGRRQTLLLIAILVLAAGLRLYKVDSQSLWNDEGTSIALAQRDIPTILRNASDDIHPPLYYLLLGAWVRLSGTSEFAARSLSVVIGVLCVAGTFFLADQLVSSRCSLLSALFAAVSPFQVYYSQEARMYILGVLAALALVGSTRALLTAWDRQPRLLSIRAGALVLAALFVLYTHYYGATVLVAANIAFLIWWVGLWRARGEVPWPAFWWWALLMVVVLAGFAPWLSAAWSALIHWPAVSSPMSLAELARSLMTVLPLGITAPPGMLAAVVPITAALLSVCGSVALFRQTHTGRSQRWLLWLMTAYLAMPLLIMYLGSLSRPMYNPKFILLVTPALHLFMAAGVDSIFRHRTPVFSPRARVLSHGVALTATGIILAGSFWSLDHLYNDPAYARDDYRGIVAYVHATADDDAAILINAPSQIETVDYYHDEPPPMYPLARERPMNASQTISELESISKQHSQLYGIFWATADSDPDGLIEDWLAEHTFKTMDRWYGNIRLAVYSTAAGLEQIEYTPIEARFGEDIWLRGYRLWPSNPRSGEILQLSLEWDGSAQIERRYTVFAQVLDSRQHIVGQHDSEPAGGRLPTDLWETGHAVVDNHGILVQPGTIPGNHTLLVGLYDSDTGERLPIAIHGEPIGDAPALAQMEIAGAVRLPTEQELSMEQQHQGDWEGLQLAGHSLYPVGGAHLDDPSINPGDALELVLYWRKDEPAEPPESLQLSLCDLVGRCVWSESITPCYGQYPWDAWRQGEIVRDIRHIRLPSEPGRGTLKLVVGPEPPETGDRVTLEKLRIGPR